MDSILETKPKVIVETGTHRGLTTCYLATAAKVVGAEVHTYDPYEWGAAGNFRKFPDLPITHHQKPGKECELDRIDWAFIDGFHEKEEVLAEIDTIFPKLSPGATVFFHDTNGSSPTCDVPGAITERGLKVEQLSTLNGMMKYVHQNVSRRRRRSVHDTETQE
jgi:cephalosporin hydroxylase